MKKFLSVTLTLALLCSAFAGCGSAPAATASSEASKAETSKVESSAESSAAPTSSGTMTLYYSHAADWSDPIIKEFQEVTGIKVDLVGAGTGELISRVQAESANPLADVLWGGVIDSYVAIPDYLESYTSTEDANIKDLCKDTKDHKWYGFDVGPMVIVYNTKLVSEQDAPKSWEDLTDPKWKGKIACADPLKSSSSFATVMAMIMAFGKDDGKGYEFVNKLVTNLDGKIAASSSATFKGVSDGEYSIGLTYEEAALKYIAAGSDMKIVYPKEGTTISPSGIAIVKGSKNIDNAKKFIDFCLSKNVQSQLGTINRRTVRTDVTDPETTFEKMENIPLVTYDIGWVAAHKEEFGEKWKEFVTQ